MGKDHGKRSRTNEKKRGGLLKEPSRQSNFALTRRKRGKSHISESRKKANIKGDDWVYALSEQKNPKVGEKKNPKSNNNGGVSLIVSLGRCDSASKEKKNDQRRENVKWGLQKRRNWQKGEGLGEPEYSVRKSVRDQRGKSGGLGSKKKSVGYRRKKKPDGGGDNSAFRGSTIGGL